MVAKELLLDYKTIEDMMPLISQSVLPEMILVELKYNELTVN